MKMIDSLSVVMITRNAASTLGRALASTAGFHEVILYDNGSSDCTLDIAAGYPNVKIFQGEFQGFGPTKNSAMNLASHDWILSIDADEEISPDLFDELAAWRPASPRIVFEICRHNYLMGRHVRVGGWGNDWLVRLFNRNVHSFGNVVVHESIVLRPDSKVVRLKGALIHHAVEDLGEFLVKINRYSTLKNESDVKLLHPLLILLRSVLTFLRSYVLQRGFRAGWRGMVIAFSKATGVFFKYIKAYAKPTS